MITVTYRFNAEVGAKFVAPTGVATPHCAPVSVDVEGAEIKLVGAPDLHQMLIAGRALGGQICLRVQFEPDGPNYPEAMFHPTDSRYTRSAAGLCQDARNWAEMAGGGEAGVRAVVNQVAELFHYGHPEERFYDGQDEMPQLCNMAVGSCVDINAYLVAALRAAGYEAGYIYGVFVPEEKKTWAEDGHCWVVSRHNGQCQEWDIAHFLKMGCKPVQAALNPKRGVRLPLAHSMGWRVPALGIEDAKLMGVPFFCEAGRLTDPEAMEISLEGYDLLVSRG